MVKIKSVGKMDNTKDHTLESHNIVYDIRGMCPTVTTCCGGGHQPNILTCEIKKKEMLHNDKTIQCR